MKHRIRKTGEIISVISFNGDTTRTNSDSVCYIDSKGCERKEPYNYYLDLEEYEPINWEEKRLSIAKDILCSVMSNPDPSMHPVPYCETISNMAEYSVALADALIKCLKK